MERTKYFIRNDQKQCTLDLPREYSEHETMHAWENFLSGDQPANTNQMMVRSEILDSWSRSNVMGIDAQSPGSPITKSQEDVHHLRRKNSALCRAANAAFERLGPHLMDTGAVLVLTDKTGTIIDIIGDRETLDDGHEINLVSGGVWDEAAIGTNGIGTALRTKKPFYVHASEHFAQGIKSWTCTAVPIIDPMDTSVVGVVDLSGPPDIFRPHNTALVVAAAREIEIALAEFHREERANLLEAFIHQSRKYDARDGVVLLDSQGRIVLNRNTEESARAFELDLTIGRKMVELSPETTCADLAAVIPKSIEPKGIDLLRLDGRLKGAALVLPGQSSASPSRTTQLNIPARPNVDEDDICVIGDSLKMQEAIDYARRAGQAGATVLIQGETGVGKELFARLVHHHHKNGSGAPYVAVNCAAISGELVGGELFGHVAGAFTGALREGKPGKFEIANGGVLCLDEVGDMPLELQTYLLRALEQRAIYRIGDDVRRPVDVQLVAVTNHNLRSDIEEGRFRRDLFYRIATITIEVPPLRERGQDIEQLVQHFNRTICEKFNRPELHFDDATIATFFDYHWPGNVRELRNTIERLALLSKDGHVTVDQLPEEIVDPSSTVFLPGDVLTPKGSDALNLSNVEAVTIQKAIAMKNGNLTKVAESLGISRPTLYRKMKQYGIAR